MGDWPVLIGALKLNEIDVEVEAVRIGTGG